jgi:hypothetical protein
MPFFLKSKAVFKLELKFLILNFSKANPKKNSFGLRLQKVIRYRLRKF